MVFSLIVKGDREKAIEEAAKRGIMLCEVRGLDRQVIGYTPATRRTHAIVAKWFGEVHQLIMGQGYPPGTLVHYTEHAEIHPVGTACDCR